MKLTGKVAVITGAGNGIGRGIAREMIREGAAVVIATLLEEEGESAVREFREGNGHAIFIQTDVSSEESIVSMTKEAIRHFGTIDILVNNAGITVFKPISEATSADWERDIGVDLRSVFLCSKYISEHMIKHRSGSIINIASIHASVTHPHAEMYAAAKSGIKGMTRSMALSLGENGVRVNAISPGFVENSPRFREWTAVEQHGKPKLQELLDKQALKDIVQPKDIGRLAVFLGSDDARLITGTEILVDAGASLRL